MPSADFTADTLIFSIARGREEGVVRTPLALPVAATTAAAADVAAAAAAAAVCGRGGRGTWRLVMAPGGNARTAHLKQRELL